MNNDFFYLEDASVGQKFHAGPTLVTEEMIIAYAKQYDPQDFHTDPVKAKDTMFGELIASGWHTASLTMRMILEATPKIKGGMVGRAVDKMSWPRPVKPGDQLSLVIEVLEIMSSDKRPEHGMMRTKNTTLNQHQKVVMEAETVIFVPRRPK